MWVSLAAHPERVEVVVATDWSDPPTPEQLALKQEAEKACFLVCDKCDKAEWVPNTGPANCVSGWNTAAAATSGDIILTIADDFQPLNRWDLALTQVAPVRWWEAERVVWVSDGYNTDIFTLSILTRKRYQRFGYVFFPSYQSMFTDTEFSFVAKQDHVVIDGRALLFEHMHPDAKKRVRDAADLVHASTARWQFGETLFYYRLGAGFPMDSGPVAEARATRPVRYAVVVQAIKDDLCLEAVCRRILEEGKILKSFTPLKDGIGALFLFCPDLRWDGVVADPAGRKEVADIGDKLAKEGWPVSVINFRVQDVANVNQPRIVVETECRNWYQTHCAQEGFEHCIIMDGDELWKPGLLAQMNEMVRERWPMSIYTGMTPVAGLPGFPIEAAKDKATIYAPSNNTFESCRGAWGYRHELVGNDIYHFTEVRKTMAELVDKNLNSGHSDDASYDFKGWVQEILIPGKIVPGLSGGVHMWRRGSPDNVWPSVRAWTPEEWSLLPDSVKPYLGSPTA
jgi:hypothetical protein